MILGVTPAPTRPSRKPPFVTVAINVDVPTFTVPKFKFPPIFSIATASFTVVISSKPVTAISNGSVTVVPGEPIVAPTPDVFSTRLFAVRSTAVSATVSVIAPTLLMVKLPVVVILSTWVAPPAPLPTPLMVRLILAAPASKVVPAT